MLSWIVNKLQKSWVSPWCMTITYYHYVLFSSAVLFEMIIKSILSTSFETNFGCLPDWAVLKLCWSVAKKVRNEIMTINVLNFCHSSSGFTTPHTKQTQHNRKFQEMNISTIIKQSSKHIWSQFDSIRMNSNGTKWNKTSQVESDRRLFGGPI